jgi:aspartyl protease family protein
LASENDPRNPPRPWGAEPPPHRRFGWRLLILGVAFAALLVALFTLTPGIIRDDDQIWLVRLVAIAAVCVVLLARSRQRLTTAAAQAAVWCGLLLLVVIGYGYRTELSAIVERTTANLFPSRGQVIDAHTVSFPISRDGHFWVDAVANGTKLRFLVDTGASGIVLTEADAKRLGFSLAKLSFSETFYTANGRTRGAPVTLNQLRIGPIELDHVRASVNEGELQQSLLGMQFLAQMTKIEISGDVLTLRK